MQPCSFGSIIRTVNHAYACAHVLGPQQWLLREGLVIILLAVQGDDKLNPPHVHCTLADTGIDEHAVYAKVLFHSRHTLLPPACLCSPPWHQSVGECACFITLACSAGSPRGRHQDVRTWL